MANVDGRRYSRGWRGGGDALQWLAGRVKIAKE
jgi:hypothetical protein